MRDLPFARYHLDNPTECEEFVGALRSLLERVPLTVDLPDLLRHWRWFGEWSLGCIGVLGDWLVETVDALYREGAPALTIEALTRHALQPDQRVRMEMEARTGEHKVERAKAQSQVELERLLGKTPMPAEANGATPPPTPQIAGTGARRIERAATRDPVGETEHSATTSKCTFAGRLEIEPARFLASSVSRVECPACQALRQITPRSGVLRFPSHSMRKTRSVQTEQRWVRREMGWEVVSGRAT
jgi:hypothetical protein